MGSLEGAMSVGFICRLCSKPKRTVVFIFGVRGQQMDLQHKINSYLPIQVTEQDDLPKTICEACLDKILLHHQLLERIQEVQRRFLMMRNENNISFVNTGNRHTDAVPETESEHNSMTRSVDSTEPAEAPAQEPNVSTTHTQQSSVAATTETRAASAGLRNEQEHMRTYTLPRTGAIRKRRRIFRVVKISRRRF